MFEQITGTSTSFNASGITDSSKNFDTDYFKNWTITINSVEYIITGNTKDTINFANSLTGNAVYKIDLDRKTIKK